MERRSGTRYRVEIPVYAETHSGAVSSVGYLLDVSLTGGFLLTTLPAELHSRISLRPVEANREMTALRLEGLVVRRSFAGLGIAWCEPATELIRALGLDGEKDDDSATSTASGS
ncbi:MAG TPA: PilZ domain-containing protein [Steroidobacteraceae bacterium]